MFKKFGSKRDLATSDMKCNIRLLDDNDAIQLDFTKEHKGQYLLDQCYKNLNLLETDYFGLRFYYQKQRTWLDPTRPIIKQIKGVDPISFDFRVKFYPADPNRLKEEITRYFLYLQLRRDLLRGRLSCSSHEAATLMAYVIQSELGDYDPDVHEGNYVQEFKLMLNQNSKLEENVREIHQTKTRGQTPAEAELNFLKYAAILETYGIDPHSVKDQKGVQVFVGINYGGILTFQSNRKIHHYKWNEIQKITYESKMFIVHVRVNEKKSLVGYKCPTVAACHFLWRCAVEQRYFFTMTSSSEIPLVTTGGGIFSKSCKLRYSGRVEKEVLSDIRTINRKGSGIHRSYSTTSAPPSMRTLGRSSTIPTPSMDQDPEKESPDRSYASYHEKVVPYLNYSTYSEPDEIPANVNNSPAPLETFEEEEWDASMTSSLPTEFDLRPDLTPTGDQVEILTFETPTVHVSPSHNFSIKERNSDDLNQSNNKFQKQNDDSKTKKDEVVDKIIRSPRNKVYAIVRTSILTSLLLLLLFSCLVIVIIESDSSLLAHLRKLPEMVIIRREYYEPIKNSIIESVVR